MKKKKAGILTLYFNYNYGAVLQAYALQRIIREQGVDVEEIRYYREIDGKSTYKHKEVSFISKVKKSLNKGYFILAIIRRIFEKIYNIPTKIMKRRILFDQFIKEEIKESDLSYDGHKEVAKCVNKYDIFVCGSDNIWNKNMLDTSFMLDFVPESKLKIAYAPGMSTTYLSDEQSKIIIPCVKKINYLSCRESTGAALLSSFLGDEIPVVLDPTLLLNADEWSEIQSQPTQKKIPSEYIFCYFCGDEEIAREKTIELKKITNLPIVTIPDIGGYLDVKNMTFGDYRLYEIGPREFIYLVNHAKYVLTDSFHGTVFSIIFKKSFMCFRRFKEQKDESLNYRIDNILKLLKIEGNYIVDINTDMKELLENKIDWNCVYTNLKNEKENSIEYLVAALFDKKNLL